jgi:anti-sigma regulatory factor (Ser/Thr protein kinase)
MPRREFDPHSRLVEAARPVMAWLGTQVAGTPLILTLTDGNGTLLLRYYGPISSDVPPVGTDDLPGDNYAEQGIGTNGVGLAVSERRLVTVTRAEHYTEAQQSSACMSAPLHDPVSGLTEGILDFSSPSVDIINSVHDLMRKGVQGIESGMLRQHSAGERELLRAYRKVERMASTADSRFDLHPFNVDDLTPGMLAWQDLMILKEKAAELLSRGQRAAVRVALPDSRSVVLVSRPVTGSSGTQGFVIEALMPGGAQYRNLGEVRPAEDVLSLSPGSFSVPPARHDGASGSSGEAAPADEAQPENGVGGRQLLMVGEPEAGKFAIAARRRLELLSEASIRIGRTLDVTRTAEELAEISVPEFSDYVTVDLFDVVLQGKEPVGALGDMRRTAVGGITDAPPFQGVGDNVVLKSTTPQARSLMTGQSVLEPDIKDAAWWLSRDPAQGELFRELQIHSLITIPLSARDTVLGVVSFFRSRNADPFGDDDRSLAEDLATRAAVCIDNARRYTREHSTAIVLQRALLPRALPEQSAIEAAFHYQPAESGVGGDWFDVIPLSGARTALVMGDVVGHGLNAAVVMGRLRTAVLNFASLDLPPDELLTHMDSLVRRLDSEKGDDTAEDETTEIIGATCLYAIYDPTTQMCSFARAGHLPPAVVPPDGQARFLDSPPGLPLGVGGLPFTTVHVHVPEGSQLILYTDGLLNGRRDIDAGLDQLMHVLARPGRKPEETCQAIVDSLVTEHPDDDIAIIVARTRAFADDKMLRMELPPDPSAVSDMRGRVAEQLAQWGLVEQAFAVELILSELVTNAMRYGRPPIRLRLLRDRTLTCEVFDGSATSPHLMLATETDEGGRGLFLVAQLARAWGTRYTADGKVIWAELNLAPDGQV